MTFSLESTRGKGRGAGKHGISKREKAQLGGKKESQTETVKNGGISFRLAIFCRWRKKHRCERQIVRIKTEGKQKSPREKNFWFIHLSTNLINRSLFLRCFLRSGGFFFVLLGRLKFLFGRVWIEDEWGDGRTGQSFICLSHEIFFPTYWYSSTAREHAQFYDLFCAANFPECFFFLGEQATNRLEDKNNENEVSSRIADCLQLKILYWQYFVACIFHTMNFNTLNQK